MFRDLDRYIYIEKTYFDLGKRLGISVLLSDATFHIPSADTAESDQNHNMDSEHFLKRIGQTCLLLRQLCSYFLPNTVVKPYDFFLGSGNEVMIVLNNATWYNRLTDETTPPKRSWHKELIIE